MPAAFARALPWLLLCVTAIALYCSWRVHSMAWMLLDLLVACAAFCGFTVLRYRSLFPQGGNQGVIPQDTPLTATEVQALRARSHATDTAAALEKPMPALAELRAAAERVNQRENLRAAHDAALQRVAEAERRAAEAERRAREAELRLQDVDHATTPASGAIPVATAAPVSVPDAAPAMPPKPAARLPDLREEGWNPYAGANLASSSRAADAGLPAFTPDADMSTLCKRYLQPLFAQQALPEGIGYRPWLDHRSLDFSPDSLMAVDALLDRIRNAEHPTADAFLGPQDNRNFLALLGFYAGTLIGIERARPASWFSREHFIAAHPQSRDLLPTGFAGELACMVGTAPYAPLDAICKRFFDGAQAASVHAAAMQIG